MRRQPLCAATARPRYPDDGLDQHGATNRPASQILTDPPYSLHVHPTEAYRHRISAPTARAQSLRTQARCRPSCAAVQSAHRSEQEPAKMMPMVSVTRHEERCVAGASDIMLACGRSMPHLDRRRRRSDKPRPLPPQAACPRSEMKCCVDEWPEVQRKSGADGQ